MIETTVLNYLSEKLTEKVYMEVPKDPTTPFVVVEKTGSSFENRVDTATMAFQSYGASLEEAAKLNEKVKSVVEGMVELGNVSKCYLNSDYNFTDTSTKQYRYQALYVITYIREE